MCQQSDFLLKSIKIGQLLGDVCVAHVQCCGMVGSTKKKLTPDGTKRGWRRRTEQKQVQKIEVEEFEFEF